MTLTARPARAGSCQTIKLALDFRDSFALNVKFAILPFTKFFSRSGSLPKIVRRLRCAAMRREKCEGIDRNRTRDKQLFTFIGKMTLGEVPIAKCNRPHSAPLPRWAKLFKGLFIQPPA